MRKTVQRLADRMVSAVAPKATAGACPCGDTYVGYCGGCGSRRAHLYRTSCDCSRTTSIGCVSC
ncbi:hypothetical protein [Streptomyces sp. SID13031]|uniref:hypothetical protein n=1 Tax=Streptomyces sp. SID13031 TaxID=2706046 RepID=UPI0013CD5A07|nr:hypothetical protein [Streptomyces sp. SID13031]NEA31288.1 hypothetical protein [Streptomyces sp. SID13031]